MGKKIFALTLGMIFALLAAELVVRLFFQEPVVPRLVVDPGYGVRANWPGVTARFIYPGDYDVRISTNEAGLRGTREYSLEKPDGVRRVVLLGDSFIFGFGVSDQNVISAVLEGMLNDDSSQGAATYEVINPSVSGFGQAEELITFENKGVNYEPDYVIAFYFSNDIGNNAVSRLFEIDEDGALVRTGAEFLPGVKAGQLLYGFPPMRVLLNSSQLWNLVRQRLSSLVQRALLRREGLARYSDTKDDASELTVRLLEKFNETVKEHGSEFILFIIPTKDGKSNVPELDWEGLGIKIIDGREFLTRDSYFIVDGHWNAVGHKQAAERIARTIMAGQSVPGKASENSAIR